MSTDERTRKMAAAPILKKKIQGIADKIAKEFKPEKIILFGSYAWGRPGPDSDVDLFIMKETQNTRELASEIGGSIFPRPFPIDIIIYRPAHAKRRRQKDFFIKNIFEKGRVLYAK